MELVIKSFDELSNNEILDIFKLRVAVFVVEQNCVYQEIDEFDAKSIHIYLKDHDEIIAYLRVLPQHTTFENASIGRVISTKRS